MFSDHVLDSQRYQNSFEGSTQHAEEDEGNENKPIIVGAGGGVTCIIDLTESDDDERGEGNCSYLNVTVSTGNK